MDDRLVEGESEKLRVVKVGNWLSRPVPVLQVVVVDPEILVLVFVVTSCAHSYVPVSPEGEVALPLKVMPGVPIGKPKDSMGPEVGVSISHCPRVVETVTEVGPVMLKVAVAEAVWLWLWLST